MSKAERLLQTRDAAAEALESECQTFRNRLVESEHRHHELQDELASLHSQLAAAREVGAAAIAALKAEPAAPCEPVRNDVRFPWAPRLLGRKALLLVNATEMLDTESQESYAEWS